jgi:hypothetical protein
MSMNLADMLCYADISELTRIAEAYECPCSSHSKNELIQSILTAVQRKDAMEQRVSEMTAGDFRFLNSLLFESRSAYSLEELKAKALGGETAGIGDPKEPSPEEPSKAPVKRSRKKSEAPVPIEPEELARRAIARFKRFGWLFNGFSQQTRTLFQVPEDVKDRLKLILENRYRLNLDIRDEPAAYRDERNLLLEDLVHFIRFVRDNDVPLTAEGVMYKRQTGIVLEGLSVAEAIPKDVGWRFGYGRHFREYPNRFSLLYDFAYFQAYVAEHPDRLVLTEEGRKLADGAAKPDPAKLFRFWLRLYKGPIPNLTTLVQWIARLSPQWTTAESLFHVLQPLIRPYYYDSKNDILEKRVLLMLMHLGIVRVGEMDEGIGVVRLTPQGAVLVSGQPFGKEDTIVLGQARPY